MASRGALETRASARRAGIAGRDCAGLECRFSDTRLSRFQTSVRIATSCRLIKNILHNQALAEP
jgi:hypothetical protein